MLLQRLDLRLGQHPAVAHQHHPRQPELLPQLLHLIRHRRRIARIPGIHIHRDRTPLPVRQQSPDNDRQSLLAIPVMAVLSQGAMRAVVVTAANVVEHERAVLEMLLGQPPFDFRFAGQEPVQRVVQLIHIRIFDRELLGQGRRLPEPRGAELGAVMEQPVDDHGQDEIPLAGALGRDQGLQSEFSDRPQDGIDMAMREAANRREEVAGTDERLVAQQPAQGINLVLRPVGEVGQGAFADLLALAPAFAEQDGGRGGAVGNGFDVHGNTYSINILICQAHKS